MISIYCGVRPQQRLVHFHSLTNLYRTHRIGGDGLIDVAQPRDTRGRTTGTALRNAIRLQRSRRFKNRFVNLAHGIDRIVRRFVVVFWVVACGHAIYIVELVSIEVPISNESLGQLLVIRLDLRQRRAQRCQISRHASGLAVFVQDQPVRMLFHHLRDAVRM